MPYPSWVTSTMTPTTPRDKGRRTGADVQGTLTFVLLFNFDYSLHRHQACGDTMLCLCMLDAYLHPLSYPTPFEHRRPIFACSKSGMTSSMQRLGIVVGNPWVSQTNPYPYPQKPIPMTMGVGFHGYGYGFLWVLWVQKPIGNNIQVLY